MHTAVQTITVYKLKHCSERHTECGLTALPSTLCARTQSTPHCSTTRHQTPAATLQHRAAVRQHAVQSPWLQEHTHVCSVWSATLDCQTRCHDADSDADSGRDSGRQRRGASAHRHSTTATPPSAASSHSPYRCQQQLLFVFVIVSALFSFSYYSSWTRPCRSSLRSLQRQQSPKPRCATRLL